MKIVIALGGNMISDATNKAESFEDQVKRIEETAKIITDIIEKGHNVVLTHGNGPQVGSLLLQQQAEVEETVSLPLNILGALTQSQIGVTLQHALLNEFSQRCMDRKVLVIPSTVIVDSDDPAFNDPSKPVGPYFDEEGLQKRKEKDVSFNYTKNGSGYRQVVPSPQPVEILEQDVIDTLSKNHLVIALGGGGTPAVMEDGKIIRKAAVIDKDLASSLLAQSINADLLMILTNVKGVYRNFNKNDQEFLPTLTRSQARALLEQEKDAKGSMEPKISAGVVFTKGDTIITSPEYALESLDGKAGTRITN